MCKKCLYLRDGDDGVDWQPIHVVTIPGLKRTSRRKQKSPNWAALRGLEITGLDQQRRGRWAKQEPLEFDPDKKYTDRELEILADQFLREDAKAVDPDTGKARGIGGKDPILFEEHIYARRRREIFNENGVPDPSLVSGIYHRTHPQGRKVNSEEQRRKHGASYYR